jgi:hypothetical protein
MAKFSDPIDTLGAAIPSTPLRLNSVSRTNIRAATQARALDRLSCASRAVQCLHIPALRDVFVSRPGKKLNNTEERRHETFAHAVAAGIPIKHAYEMAGYTFRRPSTAYQLAGTTQPPGIFVGAPGRREAAVGHVAANAPNPYSQSST